MDIVQNTQTPLNLLVATSNRKLGRLIHVFSLPVVETCPGRTPACEAACYAKSGFLAYPSHHRADALRLAASRGPDFVDRVLAEVLIKYVRVVRIHVSGDFYDAEYTAKWATIAARTGNVRFFAYTRSWRSPDILVELQRLSVLDNVSLWLSADRNSGRPPVVAGARTALMLDSQDGDDLVAVVQPDLVFRTRRHRSTGTRSKVLNVPVCPHERHPVGAKVVRPTCSECRLCFTEVASQRSSPSPQESRRHV